MKPRTHPFPPKPTPKAWQKPANERTLRSRVALLWGIGAEPEKVGPLDVESDQLSKPQGRA